ncbi:MAG: monovalent cation:proton antiporter family protein [Anaerolineales bacterium]
MQEVPRSFIPLLIVIGLAFLVPILLSRFKRLHLPVVVGEIVVGILVGRSGLGWVPYSDPVLDMLAEFGFVFLMFLAGMEIDFSSLGISPQTRRERTQFGPAYIGSLNFAATLILSGLISYWLWYAGLIMNVWLVALILSTTSLGVVVPILKERGLIGNTYGQTLLVTALIADFATMFLITIDVAVISSGLTFDILLIGLLFVAMFLIYHFSRLSVARFPSLSHILDELSSATTQIKVRAAFTVMLIFVVLSEILGTEIILGAFLAGVIVSLLRRQGDKAIHDQLETIGYGFFIPIFFIMVGVRFNLSTLLGSTQALLLVPVMLAAALVVKVIPALVFRLRYRWSETWAAGAILSARLSLIIAAAEIGMELGVITEAMDMSIILVAMITVTVAPIVFVRFSLTEEKQEPKRVIVVGAGELGLQVASELRLHHEAVLVLDAEPRRVERARQQGYEAEVVNFDALDEKTNAYLTGAGALICTNSDTHTNMKICHIVRTNFGLERLISIVSDPPAVMHFENEGIVPVVTGQARARLLTLLARNPSVYELLTRTDDDKEVWEVTVMNPDFEGKVLRDLQLPGDVLVLTVRRNGELLVPHGNTALSFGDQITLAGSEDFVDHTHRVFS